MTHSQELFSFRSRDRQKKKKITFPRLLFSCQASGQSTNVFEDGLRQLPPMQRWRYTHTRTHTRGGWVIMQNHLHKLLRLSKKNQKKKQFAGTKPPPPCVPASHLGSPHASAKAISCGFASYTVTTSETLASYFHFIPSIRDIQWFFFFRKTKSIVI